MTDSNDAAQHPAVPLGKDDRPDATPLGDATPHHEGAHVAAGPADATYGDTTGTDTATGTSDEVHNHGAEHHASLADLANDGSTAHLFDQTNGLADGLSGDSEENEDLQGSESSTGDGRLTFDDTEGGGNVDDGGGFRAGGAADGEVTHP